MGPAHSSCMNTGDDLKRSTHRLLSTIAWKIDERVDYALEGSVFISGAAVEWLRDGLGIIDSVQDVEALASSVPDTGGVTVVPALTGLGAPHWDAAARGTILGLTRGSTAAHIARATLEAIAFQTRDVVDAMSADSGISVDQPSCRRRRISQRSADADSGRSARRPGHSTAECRDDGSRRRVSGRTRLRLVARPSDLERSMGRRPGLRTGDRRSGAREPVRKSGDSPSIAPAIGRSRVAAVY